jgi:hypothetical protein
VLYCPALGERGGGVRIPALGPAPLAMPGPTGYNLHRTSVRSAHGKNGC